MSEKTKDYSVLEGMIKHSEDMLNTAFDKGYKQGYETGVATQGFMDGYSEKEIKDIEERSYKKGLSEAWSLASAISCMDTKKQFEIFNESGDANVFGCYTAQGALDKLKEYEQKQNEIKVGDEVYLIDECHPRVVTHITKMNGENPAAVQFTESGRWVVDDVTELHKTGRHFDQIEEVLKALKEGDPE